MKNSNYIYIEYYNDRWHLKGPCFAETIDHAKTEFGENWKENLCASNEKLITIQELKDRYPELYEKIATLI